MSLKSKNYTWPGLISHYREFLPVTDKTPVVTLQEGMTPLIECCNLVEHLKLDFRLYLKFEGGNPTGSFKDRGMTMAMSKAMEEGSKAVMCASTGNTSASAAAYAARAGVTCAVILPKGAIAMGKLSQALMHGAEVIAIEGNFDDALRIVREITDKYPITLVNSLNPFRIEGQTTGAYEICDQLGRVPDYHCIPVGNAGNITAYWRGYNRYKDAGKISTLPKMCGFQAAGSAPIYYDKVIEKPETLATAIRIGNPASWQSAKDAISESSGHLDIVTDDEIVAAYKLLAKYEGVFVEPASAASVAGLIKINANKFFEKGSTVVCINTGHGLKDPDNAIKFSVEPITLPNDTGAVLKHLNLDK